MNTLKTKILLLENYTIFEKKKPKKRYIKNKPSRYPYYSFFTKDKFFLPLSKKIWEGKDLSGDPLWERFVQLFNEAMNNGWIAFKAPDGRNNGVRYARGEVEWESDEVMVLVLTEMRHFRDNPLIESSQYTMWEHERDSCMQEEMIRLGWSKPDIDNDFIKEEL